MRFLAKKGVNMIRLHQSIPNAKEGAKITDINEQELDTIFRYVAAARKNGPSRDSAPLMSGRTLTCDRF